MKYCITFAYMKDASIIIRVSKETKNALEKLAQKDNRTLSDYLRLYLEKLIKNQIKYE